MNKGEFVSAVAGKAGLKKTDAEKAVNAVFETIKEALKEGDDVRFIGFGAFGVTKRQATDGRNPRTGKVIKIPARKVPKFKAGKELKQAVNS